MKRPSVLLVVQVLAVAGILGCLVAIAARHPWRADLTPDRRFTLTAHTRSVLAALPFPVTVTYFYAADDQVTRREVEALLRLYAALSRLRPWFWFGLSLRTATRQGRHHRAILSR